MPSSQASRTTWRIDPENPSEDLVYVVHYNDSFVNLYVVVVVQFVRFSPELYYRMGPRFPGRSEPVERDNKSISL